MTEEKTHDTGVRPSEVTWFLVSTLLSICKAQARQDHGVKIQLLGVKETAQKVPERMGEMVGERAEIE